MIGFFCKKFLTRLYFNVTIMYRKNDIDIGDYMKNLRNTDAKLTTLENNFLKLLRDNNNVDEYQCSETCNYFVLECFCEYVGIESKIYRGVLSSLLKKKVIFEGEFEFGMQYFSYAWEE